MLISLVFSIQFYYLLALSMIIKGSLPEICLSFIVMVMCIHVQF